MTMNIKYQNFFSKNFFLLILFFSLIINVFLSYNRFIVRKDYIVRYEGSCDPVTKSCFIGCKDDACTEEYFYFKIQKYALDLHAECGADITNCEQANRCLPDDRECSVTYCDSKTDGDNCSNESNNKENNQMNPKGDQDIITNNIKI